MLKKVLSATVVLALVSANGSVSYSDVIDTVKTTDLEPTAEVSVSVKRKLEVYKPETGIISNRIVLLSGIAAEGSKIIVEVYSTPSTSLKDINAYSFSLYDLNSGGLAILNSSKDQTKRDIYLPPVVKEVEVGAFGYFAEELELKIGLNKINVYIEGSDDSQVKYVYVNDYSKAEELIKRIDSMEFFNTMKEILGQEETKDFLKLNTLPKTQDTEEGSKDTIDNEEQTNDSKETP